MSREAWLEAALKVLAKDPYHLRIEELANRLGVSKGSFYWHFEDRSEFVKALAEYWRDTDTAAVVQQIRDSDGTPEERLRKLMTMIVVDRHARLDAPIRAFARIEPDILPIIRETDKMRMEALRGLFEEMGFEEPELSMRTRVFVVFHSFNDALAVELTRKEATEQLDARHAFFTRR